MTDVPPVRLVDVTKISLIDYLFGFTDRDGIVSDGPISIADFTDQLLASTALATVVADMSAQLDAAETLANTAIAAAAAGAIPPRTEVAAGQTVALPAYTYNNGAAGVGATITANANGALAASYFDNVSGGITVGKRLGVLLEGGANGLYNVTQVGDATHPYILTRAADADTAAELHLCIFLVKGGDTLKGQRWQCQQKSTDIVVGTTSLTFARLNDDGSLAAEVVAGRGSQASLVANIDRVDARAGIGVTTTNDLNSLGLRRFAGTGNIVPIAVMEDDNKIVLGYDKASKMLVGTGLSTRSGPEPLDDLTAPPILAEYNGLIFYGQSLSVGAKALPLLSTTQPYLNKTHNGGPRRNGDGASWKALVEDDISPAPDGGTNRGETPCSGAANYASTLAALDGVAPADFTIFASSAGYGGQAIAALDKDTGPTSIWTLVFKRHIEDAKAVEADFAVHAVAWMQGEQDAATATPYATYRGLLAQLAVDIAADVPAWTAQAGPVHLLTYQLSYEAATHPDIALAQLSLARERDKIILVTPTYHLSYDVDGTHLTNAGSKRIGAYFGRAYKQLVVDGKRPKWLDPVSATRRGDQVRVRYDVPHRPLVIDTATLAPTIDYGFRVVDSNGTVAIEDIYVAGDELIIELAATPVGATTVRGGLDYLGSGLLILNGASTNLRDSDPSVINIAGIDRPLYNVCPHFELTVIALGE